MGKAIDHDAMDLALANIADYGDEIYLCSAEPADYAGIAAATLGSGSLTPGDGNGDYTIGDGASPGRRLQLAEREITASANGDVTHLVVADSASPGAIKAVTTCAAFTVASGSDYTVPAYTVWEIRDPT
jgi:hypothetical protein